MDRVASACLAEDVDEDQQPLKEAVENVPTNQEEYEFIDQPSEEFFCPVTFELLLSPHQTTCCGHHLSEKAVQRLQLEGKPCPMCKETKLVTMPDKFFKRKASAVLIRCPNKSRGCEWVGEVGGSNRHTCSCPKRAWECECCDFQSTFDVKDRHEGECSRYPVPCPNKCMVPVVVEDGMSATMTSTMIVRTIPRCEVEKHRAECPLELVTCEFVDVGCDVKTTREDLKRHMEESQQQHLLTATLLNLKLTRGTIVEKDRQLAEKDKIIDQKDKQLMKLQEQLDKYQNNFMGTTKVALDRFLGISAHHFLLTKFSTCQTKGNHGDWFSDPFYSHAGGYLIKFNVETRQKEPFMTIRLYHGKIDDNNMLDWPVTFVVNLELLNQLGQHHHYSKEMEIGLNMPVEYFHEHSSPHEYIPFKTLLKKGEYVQYLHDDCLKFRMWIRVK